MGSNGRLWSQTHRSDQRGLALSHSRYLIDFEEIKKLGEGAFGDLVFASETIAVAITIVNLLRLFKVVFF